MFPVYENLLKLGVQAGQLGIEAGQAAIQVQRAAIQAQQAGVQPGRASVAEATTQSIGVSTHRSGGANRVSTHRSGGVIRASTPRSGCANIVSTHRSVGVIGEGDVVGKRYLKRQNKCFIINNNFTGKPARHLPGYDIDESRIRDTFEWLNFDVHVEKNQTKKEIVADLKSWMQEDYSDRDCFVCFILSHGTDHDNIYGEDEKPLPVSLLVNSMGKVTSLFNKPKLFFIQACRGDLAGDTIGENEPTVLGDVPKAANANYHGNHDKPVKLKAQGSDYFIYFASSEGTRSYVDKVEGSFFVKELLLTMQAFIPGEKSLSEIVTKVNERLSGKVDQGVYQACEARNKLTYEVFFDSNSTCFEKSEIRDAILDGKKPKYYLVYFYGNMVNEAMDFMSGAKTIIHSCHNDDYVEAVQRAVDIAVQSVDGIGRSAIIYEAATKRVMYSKKIYFLHAEKELLDYAGEHCPYYK